MLSLDLSTEQKSLIDLAKRFGQKEIEPLSAHYDKTREYPWDIIKKLTP